MPDDDTGTPKIEHHWHEPTQGQAVKAMYQYLADKGVDRAVILEMIDRKLDSMLAEKLEGLLNSGRFDKLLVQAVAEYVASEKRAYTENRYTFTNHLRDLAQQELRRLVMDEYEVIVRPKVRKPDIDQAQAALEKAVRT